MKSKKVLLIEDDSSLAEGLQIILKDEGYDVLYKPDGRALLATVRTYKPSIVLMDFRLPGKDGSALTKSIKSSPDTQNIPVIIMSAHQQNLRIVSKEIGANAFLLKPFEIEDLLTVIKQHIS